tara:strand:- start:458 stop:613 length:156 start_codon:yes stop_codon:yes gene_type:complete
MISKQLRQYIEKYKVIQTRGSDQEIRETEELILQFCDVEGIDPERAFEECV